MCNIFELGEGFLRKKFLTKKPLAHLKALDYLLPSPARGEGSIMRTSFGTDQPVFPVPLHRCLVHLDPKAGTLR